MAYHVSVFHVPCYSLSVVVIYFPPPLVNDCRAPTLLMRQVGHGFAKHFHVWICTSQLVP